MFNLNASPVFTAPVQLSVPGADATETVSVTFRHQTKDALAKWWAEYLAAPTVARLAEVIDGWGMHRDGKPVAYSPAALDELVQNYPAAMGELADAYMLELVRSKRKN